MEDFIRKIPKAELHVHLEGTMLPEILFQIAEKNGISIPYSIEELKRRRENFSCLEEFVSEYHDCCTALKDSDDFYTVLQDYFEYAHKDNVKYAEIMVSGLCHRSMPLEVQLQGLKRAQEEAEKNLGIKSNLILTFIKHDSLSENWRMLTEASHFKDYFNGIGLAGTEIGYPVSKFTEIIEEARKLGLCGPDGGNVTIHTGEEGSPTDMIDTLYAARPRRIDHGVRSLESPHLLSFLSKHQIPLAVAPISNRCLKVLDRYFNGRDIVRDLMDHGIAVCINSDDPAFFGAYVGDNIIQIAGTLSDQGEEDTKSKVVELCKNSFKAGFMSKSEKEDYLQMIEDFLSTN